MSVQKEDVGVRKSDMIRNRIEKIYPPGYEWKEELAIACLLEWIGFVISWQYLFRLGRMTDNLYIYVSGYPQGRYLRPDAAAESFAQLMQGSFWGFVLPLAFLAAMALWHYAFYWRNTKSIYVMRRLPKRGIILASCVKGPVYCVVLLALTAALIWLLYLGLYWLAVPTECIPRFI